MGDEQQAENFSNPLMFSWLREFFRGGGGILARHLRRRRRTEGTDSLALVVL